MTGLWSQWSQDLLFRMRSREPVQIGDSYVDGTGQTSSLTCAGLFLWRTNAMLRSKLDPSTKTIYISMQRIWWTCRFDSAVDLWAIREEGNDRPMFDVAEECHLTANTRNNRGPKMDSEELQKSQVVSQRKCHLFKHVGICPCHRLALKPENIARSAVALEFRLQQMMRASKKSLRDFYTVGG